MIRRNRLIAIIDWFIPIASEAERSERAASLPLSALLSVELPAFTSLLGAFYYGGVSSPFMPRLKIEPFDLHKVIGEVVASVQPLISERANRLVVAVAPVF